MKTFTNKQRKTLTITVFDSHRDNDNKTRLPSDLAAFKEWVEFHVSNIPREYRNTAVINQEVEEEYDWYSIHTMISYTRPETDEEVQARFESYRAQDEAKRQEELKTLERLKAKYEIPTP